MELDTNFQIVIYVLAFVSILGSCFVIASICKFGHSCRSTQLVLNLHIGQIIQDIVALPNVFNRNPITCKIAGWLHIYSGMSNIIVVVSMVITYRHMFYNDYFKISKYLNHCSYHAFAAPLVTLLPFISNSFGEIEGGYCSLRRNDDLASIVWLYLTLVWCVAVACVGMLILIYTTANIYMADVEMGVKVMKSIGLYALTTLLFWIPRLFFEIAYEQHNYSVSAAFVLVYFAGGIYTAIFMREKESMKLFEEDNKANNVLLNNEGSSSGAGGLIYSWEFEEEFDEKAAMSNGLTTRLSGGEDQKSRLVSPVVAVNEEQEYDIK